MMLIAGTVPSKDLPVIIGEVKREDEYLIIDGHRIPCTQGTAAMISAALVVTNYMKKDPPHAAVAGDVGSGNGTRALYKYLTENIDKIRPDLLALHYCLPIMTVMKQLIDAINKSSHRPFLLADAGAMYAAKAAGLAEQFDVFTPDLSEMAFLADPFATHPAYVGKHLFDSDSTQIPNLVELAYKNHNAPKLLVIKGATDHVAENGKILATINEPNIPMLEPIGGTGDTITGLVSGLIYSGLKPADAAVIAAKVNRLAGKIGNVCPATKVRQLIDYFKDVLPMVISKPA
jgi:NAD(P)H-hydrate repair Nnr-like enzyme with NAD(P)H-hydrate dehydratase domain